MGVFLEESGEHTAHLRSQAEQLLAHCGVRSYSVSKVVKGIGSGGTDNQPKLLALLVAPSIGRIVIADKDRGTRLGSRYRETLLRPIPMGARWWSLSIEATWLALSSLKVPAEALRRA